MAHTHEDTILRSQTSIHEEHGQLRCSDEIHSETSFDDEREDDVPEMDQSQGQAPEIIRRSTIESYVGDLEEEDDHGETACSSLTLFHAGYREEPYWERQLQTILPTPARLPSIRSKLSSRQGTMLQANTTEPPKDTKLVTWDGKDDPVNPHNWPAHRRWTSTILIAFFAFIAPMASTMVAPALEEISDDFNIESDIEEFLVMSIFLLAFAIGPFLWGRSITLTR